MAQRSSAIKLWQIRRPTEIDKLKKHWVTLLENHNLNT